MNATQLAAVDRSIRQGNKCQTMETPFSPMMGNFAIASGNGEESLTLSSFKSHSLSNRRNIYIQYSKTIFIIVGCVLRCFFTPEWRPRLLQVLDGSDRCQKLWRDKFLASIMIFCNHNRTCMHHARGCRNKKSHVQMAS